ncbi:MAG: quinone-dependent dihydroorotate dehydrogenase [Verrucomicrobiota bacterium JB022]|nr:quinone-dependent dihydroorotate dehydrogenase [Verrucomicrobiota bacterium JB022]
MMRSYMGLWYEKVIRPRLFAMDPENAHEMAISVMETLGRFGWLCRAMQKAVQPNGTRPIELFGLQFPTAVGMAAGMDKNARAWQAAAAYGFGHVEIGTVTARRQPGNDRPRLFRYPPEEAIINRMGFNNDGAEAIAQRLKAHAKGKQRLIPLGVNIGKTKVVPLEQAAEDYLTSFNLLADYADYIAINVSSPNTPDLRKLQGQEHLQVLLGELSRANQARAKRLGDNPIPLLLKIAPDLTFRQVDEVIQVVYETGVSGVIATNTTIARPGTFAKVNEAGGLSGKPLFRRSLEVVNYLSRATDGNLPIIGVGGITTPDRASMMMDAGASLVQVYSGFIYGGPFFPAEIAKALAPRHRDWVKSRRVRR